MHPRPTVLLVEPDPVVRELTAQVLVMSHFDVIAVDSGERGLLALRKRRAAIDWLVTGLDLPGLVDGWILADEYRSHHPERPVVCSRDPERCPAQDDFMAILPRPFAPLQVANVLRAKAGWADRPAGIPEGATASSDWVPAAEPEFLQAAAG